MEVEYEIEVLLEAKLKLNTFVLVDIVGLSNCIDTFALVDVVELPTLLDIVLTISPLEAKTCKE